MKLAKTLMPRVGNLRILFLCVIQAYLFSNATASSYEGIYSGTFSGSSEGHFFSLVDENNLMTVWGYDETWDEGFASELEVGDDGSFSGIVGETFVTGSFSGSTAYGSGVSQYGTLIFSGSGVSLAGATSSLVGQYSGVADTVLGTYDLTISVSGAGEIWIYFSGAFYENGAQGEILSSGDFTLVDSEGFRFVGNLDLVDFTIVGDVFGGDGTQLGTINLDQVNSFALSDSEKTPELVNIATRGRVGVENDIMIAGFVIEGNEDMDVLIQAVGEEIDSQLPGQTLLNPAIVLIDPEGDVIGENDDWGASEVSLKREAMGNSGSYSLFEESKSSALLESLSPGAYTVLVFGVGEEEGIALIEVYNVSNPAGAALVNISTRAKVGDVDDIVIGGFVVAGNESKTVLIQGVGNELAAPGGIDGESVLGDPHIALVNSSGNVIESNDDWHSEDKAAKKQAMEAAGSYVLEDTGSSAGILTELEPGAYTVLLSGVNGEQGISLVEIYELD
ncbi:hypothetical protein MLD52_11270 [Puniceicoccaceae bacterium K14]|nr:hypothetical protein [Puniceicoccaceae bacterium K14]